MPDSWIKEKAITEKMIEPFISTKAGKGVISFGLSSYGYDPRIANEFKVFNNVNCSIIDPKNFDTANLVTKIGDYCFIPPNGFLLTRTVEYFRIPRDVMVICVGKSTYARCGIIVNVTPLEPGWEGYVTLEFSNTAPVPTKIYANEGACQFIFLKASKECDISYKELKGKYMKQTEITLPKVLYE